MADETPGTAPPALSPPAAAAPPAAPSTFAPPPAAPAPFDWKTAGLDEGGMAFVTERQFKGPGDLLTSYRQLDSAFGVPPERLIKLPAPRDAGDPKVWEPIYKQLGRPETPDKYVLPLPAGDKGEFANEVRPVLHKIGLSQSQATQLSEWWNDKVAATEKMQRAELETRQTTEVAQLKQVWGRDYDARAGLVDRAAETFGMTPAQLDGLKTALGPKAAMEFLYTIGSKIAVEDATVPGMGQQSGTFTMTPEIARAKIAEYKKNGFAHLFESKDPKQRMEAHAEWNKLHQIAAQDMPPPTRRVR
jgi:hypothetical protein